MLTSRFKIINAITSTAQNNQQLIISKARIIKQESKYRVSKICYEHCGGKGKFSQEYGIKYLHNRQIKYQKWQRINKTNKLFNSIQFTLSHSYSIQKQSSQLSTTTSTGQVSPADAYFDFNNFSNIKQTPSYLNNFSPSNQPIKTLSDHYSKIDNEIKKKQALFEQILSSSERNLYKIVQECLIVLEAFKSNNESNIKELYLVQIIKKFNNKLITAYLENKELEKQQNQGIERTDRRSAFNRNDSSNNHTKFQNQPNQKSQHSTLQEQNSDAQYQLHSEYLANRSRVNTQVNISHSQNDYIVIGNKCINDKFLYYYIQTLKEWILANIQDDNLIRKAQTEIYEFLTTREVSEITDIANATLDNVVKFYLREQKPQKRQLFSFERKLRSLCFLPFLKKDDIQLYIKRLAEQNLLIYLKQAQMVTLMYDITELKPQLKDTQFVYQLQSTKVYQTLFNLNASYIKARFVLYVRKFMVCFNQVQFYQLFRQAYKKMPYPTMRTFIRLTNTLKVQSDDLHCEYNKAMNRNNYSFLLSVITSQTYTISNTTLEQLLQLLKALNNLERSGEILYEEIINFLKQYRRQKQLTPTQLEGLYDLFKFAIQQAKPTYRYEDTQEINKQLTKTTFNLICLLFDVLLPHYPNALVIGRDFLRNYLNFMINQSLFISQTQQTSYIQLLNNKINAKSKLKLVSQSFIKILELTKLSIEKSISMPQIKIQQVLETLTICARNSLHSSDDLQNNINESSKPKPSHNNMFEEIFFQTQNIEQNLYNKILKPLIKNIDSVLTKNNNMFSNTSKNKSTFIIIYNLLKLINSMSNSQKIQNFLINLKIQRFIDKLQTSIVNLMCKKIQQTQTKKQIQRKGLIKFLDISTPHFSKQILLSLQQIILFFFKYAKNLNSREAHYFNVCFNYIKSNLKIIFEYINQVAISSFKSLNQNECFQMFKLFNHLQKSKSKMHPVLLIDIKPQIYENCYYSLSIFVIHLTEYGKYYLKLQKKNSQLFLLIIQKFAQQKNIFKTFPSKKKLIMIQIILAHLIKKKYLNFNGAHLKRAEHARLVLSIMQIFEFTQNITVDLRKTVQQIQFLPNELEDFSLSILQRFSEFNNSIKKYLQANQVSLTSPTKLWKLSVEELKKQFKGQKIYEMIVRSKGFVLPFQLPKPTDTMSQNTKLMYIVQKIYEKISKKNHYQIQKKKKRKRKILQNKQFMTQIDNELQQQQSKINDQLIAQQAILDQQQAVQSIQELPLHIQYQANKTQVASPQPIKDRLLEEQIAYIKKEQLVNYIYEQHYKLDQNKLPLHYKKQTWKNVNKYFANFQNQIESLEIDEKVDEKIYKMLLLALLGYVQKVKLIAKEFHPHNFIYSVAASLDMETFTHGCVIKLSRKHKPDENVICVCASDHNYKLLYICTHILRISGENAYIIYQKTEDYELKQFLKIALPQVLEDEEISNQVEQQKQSQIYNQQG